MKRFLLAAILVLPLTSCRTPWERRLADTKARASVEELEAEIERRKIELCEEKRHHSMFCRGQCAISRMHKAEWYPVGKPLVIPKAFLTNIPKKGKKSGAH